MDTMHPDLTDKKLIKLAKKDMVKKRHVKNVRTRYEAVGMRVSRNLDSRNISKT